MNKALKRALSAVLAGLTALTFTACGGESSSESADSSAETTAASEQEAQDSAETEASDDGKTEAVWDELDNTEITAAMGMGWNLGNQLEANVNKVPSETAWGNPEITKELIDAVKAAGFNTIRIPVSYLSKIGEGPDYTIEGAWLDRIAQVVDYAMENEMFAIINIHGDGYYTVDGGWLLCADENQEEIKAKYEAVWTQIAERFKDYDEHLIFESMNEVFNGDYSKVDVDAYNNINEYNVIFSDAVRKTGSNNTKRWLLVPGWNTNIQHTVSTRFVIPEDSLCEADGKRIMISVHYYDPYNFTIDENMSSAKTQWGQYAADKSKTDNWGQEDYVDEQMEKLKKRFVDEGYPVVIGEMGVQNKDHVDASNNEYRRYWCEYVVKSAKTNGCVPVYWDNGWNGEKGFGLFDRSSCEQTQPELIEAMIRAINSDSTYEIPAVSAE